MVKNMKKMNKLIITGIFLSMMFVLALTMPGTVHAQYGCTSNYQERCSGSNLYWYDSCGNQQNLIQYCSNGCYNGACLNNYNNNCTYHSYERCSGSYLYWYDSCQNQQDIAQYCQNGCYNNSCQNNYNNNYNNYNSYGNCTYHAYKLCLGNNIYWYDSCQKQQDLYYNCTNNGQVCQYGQCTTYIQPIQPINNYPVNTYAAYYKTACSGSSIFWYDSLGVRSGLYKNCVDNNSCTSDTCSGSKCSNILRCDGSTCAVGSGDYNTYCQSAQAGVAAPTPNPVAPATPTPTPDNHCGNGLCETTLGETSDNCPNDCKLNTNTAASGLSISLFEKQDSSSNQWQKTAKVSSNSQIYFMISATNTSTVQIDNVNVSANIPGEISSLGNLQVNGVAVSGDIVSGINIGSIAPASTKLVTFEGKTQTISAAGTKQATATSNVSGATQSDSVPINFNPTQAAAAISNTPAATTGFWGFLKRWYLWILGGLVLIFLFIVVFKRLSSDV